MAPVPTYGKGIVSFGLTVATDGHHPCTASTLPSGEALRLQRSRPHIAANALAALERIEEPWRLMLASDCPYCGSQGAWMHVHSRGTVLTNGLIDPNGRVDVDCPDGCNSDNYVQAILGRLDRQEVA